ncbi:PLP-dependent aminotransferase family protein [Leucobacter sp. UCD-THU]|uniref:aminotransferase-like domain-containing protein n=1 Tax=Leucobacter sp. UCD-THU TaxID=1292023 RepID=UPI0009D97075|nr:PLP-dependent aminotransferase family protein [Leucobacter sp. UCD-THU]
MEVLERIVDSVTDLSAKGISATVAQLISSGLIPPNERLPTTRQLAQHLNVSPGLISAAWQLLVSDGLLETRGRQGTFVVDPEPPTPWRQFRHVVGSDLPLDLSTGFPDPELLVDIRPTLRELAEAPSYPGYPAEALDPELARALRSVLPVNPTNSNTLLSTHILGALFEIFSVVGPPQTRVIVAEPEFAPYLDLLERGRLQPVPVPLDAEGPVLSAVAAAIRDGAKAIVLQPRVHNPTGISTSRARLRAIAELCERNDVWILDGDYYGDLLPVPAMSAIEWAPAHTVYMRSFAKDIHPDIRVAVLVGAPKLIQEAHRRRVGGFEISRVNQDLLRLLLSDERRSESLLLAKEEYARRQRIILEVLAEHDIHVTGGGGFNIWIPVRSESDALVYLASKGIGVAPGSAFQLHGAGGPHIRVSTALAGGDTRQIGLELATAAKASRKKR